MRHHPDPAPNADSRPEAAPDDVARWREGVRGMSAEELATFERRTRRAFQHHSLIDLLVAIHNRREQLERGRWFRIRPTYRKPAGGFLAIGPRYRGDLVEGGTAVRFRHDPQSEWYETVPIEHVEANSEPPPPRRRWN